MFEIDFNNVTENEYEEVLTTLSNKKLVLLDFKPYEGPVTMQLLPNGGVQSIFGGNLIIQTNKGFYFSKEVIFDNERMDIETLDKKVKELINTVLPN